MSLAAAPPERGICVLLNDVECKKALEMVGNSECIFYVQLADAGQVQKAREAAHNSGFLGTRLFVGHGPLSHINLADNLADRVWADEVESSNDEIIRVMHPNGIALVNGEKLTKPTPDGMDDWAYPYHGPDNNPQSADKLARAPYMTQFIAEPKFGPIPQVSVGAGGRMFKAYGHVSQRKAHNYLLNTLLGINGYNGTILWERKLPEGFMIHRNTIVATPEVLYLADNKSCKLLDARTGQLGEEIVVPEGLADGPTWKWMALEGDVLYALVGAEEVANPTRPSGLPGGLGHWPWRDKNGDILWEGFDYSDPKTNFGFGRTFAAFDLKTKKLLWHHSEAEYIDSRGICMKNGRIYYYSPGKFLACLDLKEKTPAWRTSDARLLKAIGPIGKAQGGKTGFSTHVYLVCNDRILIFTGPQIGAVVAVSSKDGEMLWSHEGSAFLPVLRDDALYIVAAEKSRQEAESYQLDYETGKTLGRFPGRTACTRATGSADSIFFRGKLNQDGTKLGIFHGPKELRFTSDGTARFEVASSKLTHISPMRPPCNDGVIVANGQLYWGPWMCGCQLSLYGHIALGAAIEVPRSSTDVASRLESSGNVEVEAVVYKHKKDDKPTPWTFSPSSPARPTTPVVGQGMVFVADERGVLRMLDVEDGTLQWKVYTGGAIHGPPAYWKGRIYVGSADGWIYSYAAKDGRLVWRFRAAPYERQIPVFERLISTWPVSGGVVIHNHMLYAAAGIAHYDTTHVYALDPATGKVKWYNDSSGNLSPMGHGVSVQGEPRVRNNTLYFSGGNVYAAAAYELETGKWIGRKISVDTVFRAYYPKWGNPVSLVSKQDGTIFAKPGGSVFRQ